MQNIINFQQQTIDNSLWNFSEFQQEFADEIETRSDFDKWVSAPFVWDTQDITKAMRRQGPWVMTWYENGDLRAIRVGVNKPLTPEIINKN